MTRQATTLTAPDLSGYSDDALLTAYAALVHRIHAAEEPFGAALADDLRAQRDQVRLEALRRMGGR
jgi:hypothetical protein